MNKVLLDTNILIDFLRKQRSSRPKNIAQAFHINKAYDIIRNWAEKEIKMCISCHTLKELLQYPYISSQEEARINEILPKIFTILPTTIEAARVAGHLSRQSAEYREDHIEDCYIAATAIANKLPLYIRNPADFKYVKSESLIIIVPYQYQTN